MAGNGTPDGDPSEKTPIKDPLADLRTKVEGTNAYRVLHLEEVKMGATYWR